MVLYNTAQLYTCWKMRGHGYVDAIIGAHANRGALASISGLFTKDPGGGVKEEIKFHDGAPLLVKSY